VIGCSSAVAAQITRQVPANTFEDKFVLRQQEMAMALRPDQDELLKAVDDFVTRNTASGELNKLYRRWLDSDLPVMK
jgi:polar amino acid transport system substrate-binding protein